MNKNKNQSGFYLLSDNTDAFVARFALATIADKTLDIQYYIIHNDASGRYLTYAILAAADRGVHVRLLVDDINLSGRDSSLKMLNQHENIEIRIFNPLVNREWFRTFELIINLNRTGRRMHNKTFIADNSSAVIGGRNIGDEYFDARQSMNFIDLDLLTIGPVVNDISRSFNDYWNSNWSTAIDDLSRVKVVKNQLTMIRRKLRDRWNHVKNTEYFHNLQQSDLTNRITNRDIPFIWADATLFYDQPEKIDNHEPEKLIHFGPEIRPFFEQAKHEIIIATPYFVPGVSGTRWLENKSHDDVTIRILTNSLAATDVIAVHAGYKKYRKKLINSGIELFELKSTAHHLGKRTRSIIRGLSNSSLHAKYIIIDRRYVITGSANIDPRSKSLNTEIGVLVDSKVLAEQTLNLFEKTTSPVNSYELSIEKKTGSLRWNTEENAEHHVYQSEPHAGYLRRFAVFLLSLLPIESLL